MHEADEPNAVIDLLDAESLAGQHGGDVDPLAMQAQASAIQGKRQIWGLGDAAFSYAALQRFLVQFPNAKNRETFSANRVAVLP